MSKERWMARIIDPLVADLVAWIGSGRPYLEVMDAWKTSCPRLPVWEEANARGLLARSRDRSGTEWVHLTPAGESLLRQERG
ncbi:3-phosphoglycerate dehydrogenase [Ramlibacter ginsenosidimutans]|uniref:3-phosphoglycerate dehydrogenase n=2 Tax=Ramlibacter ginsenosidimutans TaxID=502333 RepID=A0A934TTT6_9BURK|nr:3-phosphoglycerate dehydrogenase [Ramlibacter ginsenosidimutans]